MCAELVDAQQSCKMCMYMYLFSKIGLDTAEIEPSKVSFLVKDLGGILNDSV